jgi:hypothetical protein
MAGYKEGLLWGCAQMNFKTNPPFNEMRQAFATFKKETRMAPILPEIIEKKRFSTDRQISS